MVKRRASFDVFYAGLKSGKKEDWSCAVARAISISQTVLFGNISKPIRSIGMSGKQTDKSNKAGPEQYEELKEKLVKEILEKQQLDAKLEELEDSIYEKEQDYFQESVYGNIVKGFENFGKTNVSASNRKRQVYSDEDHIFSMSSVNYIKHMMRRQGAGTSGREEIEEYEDSVEPSAANGTNNGSVPQHQGSPPRKRKIRPQEE